MKKSLLFTSLLVAFCSAQAEVDIPLIPPPRHPPPQAVNLAAERFQPMAGSLAAKTLGTAVALPVNFAGTTHERASWDIPVTLDMSKSRGLSFDFYCEDLAPVAEFCCYFRARGGWYRAAFSLERTGQWESVTIDKSATTAEESPDGWAHIDLIRISVWRGDSASDTWCAVANVGLAGGGPPQVLVVRADSRMKPGDPEAKAYGDYAATFAMTFDASGIPNAQVADSDVSEEALGGVRLVVLPYNPSLPAAAAAALEGFVAKGGKVIACYSAPPEALRLLGLRWQKYVVAEGGAFRGFAKTAGGLDGQPGFAPQGSGRTMVVGAVEGGSARVVAEWRNADGSASGIPAVTLTPTGAYIGHVWFRPSTAEGVELMNAVATALVPEFLERMAREAFAKIGKAAGHPGLDALAAEIGASATGLARVRLAHARAKLCLDNGEWRESLKHSAEAAEAALRVWCEAQPSREGEFRAFWCHSAFGLADRDWERAIRQLKEGGFNAILPNMQWAGTAYYPSAVLPQYGTIGAEGDQIAKCLAACRKHGVEMHVWKVNWNTGGHAPKAFIEMLQREGRHQVTYSGDARAEWLCPSHPANQELEVASMLEVARLYAVDGLHFDYIRYPDNDSCYCAGCKERFQARLGRPVTDWAQTRPGRPLHGAWQDFRRANISEVVRRVHDGAKAIRPGVKISAAVFSNWTQNRDRIAQDWKMWCANGWLDFICPMDYVESAAMFGNMVKQQKVHAGGVPLYPGIGLSCWREPKDPVRLLRQIQALREQGAPGFTVFNYDHHAEAVLPYLNLRKDATGTGQ